MRDGARGRSRWPGAALLAALLLPLLAVSCTAPKPPPGKTLVEFWDFPRLPVVNEWLQEAIAEFERLNPDVHIEYTRLSWAKGLERMDIAAFAGRPPDVAGAVMQLKYVEAGLLAPLDSYLDEEIPGMPGVTWREDIHPSILRAVQWEGTTWAFPWYKEGFIILVNQDIFRERGVPIPEDGQWTWDEFLEKMHRLTFDRDGDGKIDVYGIGYSTGPEKWEAYPFLFAEGMEIMSEDGRTILLDSDATRRGLRRLLALEFEERVALPGAGGIQDDVTWTAFTSRDRRLAAVSQGLWALNSVETQNRRLEEMRRERPTERLPDPLRIRVMMAPRMPGQPQTMASYGVGSMMVFDRPHDPKRTDAAARFARFLTLEYGQAINREAGLFPSRISTGNLFEGDPRYDNIWPHIADAVGPPVHPAWLKVDQVISEYVQRILLRRIDVDEGVRQMAQRAQLVLDDYWASRDAAHW